MTSEAVNDAVENAADQEAAAAAAIAEAARAEAARHTAVAATAATAAAESVTALATANAAETINENKENVTWLKQHVDWMENSLNQLGERHRQLTEAIPSMLASSQTETLSQIKSLLTPPQSTPAPTPTAATKEASEALDGQREAEQKKKNKSGPRHKGSWI